MKLGSILDGARSARSVTRPVKLKVVTKNAREERTTLPAEAAFAFVDSEDHQEALVRAEEALTKRFGQRPIPHNVRLSEQSLHFLALALRDKADPAQPFASSVDELRGALLARTSVELEAEYNRFLDDEFPEAIDDEDFEKLVEEAEGKSLRDLLTSCGFSRIQKALPSLAGHYGVSLTQI